MDSKGLTPGEKLRLAIELAKLELLAEIAEAINAVAEGTYRGERSAAKRIRYHLETLDALLAQIAGKQYGALGLELPAAEEKTDPRRAELHRESEDDLPF